MPSIFSDGKQVPGSLFGEHVEKLPTHIASLYEEARRSLAANAPTASIMVSRKILLNLAVENGLPAKNKNDFAPTYTECVNHLIEHEVPKKMKPWLDTIKNIGNEANHEIAQASEEQAQLLIQFVGQLLKVMFEMPAHVPTPQQ